MSTSDVVEISLFKAVSGLTDNGAGTLGGAVARRRAWLNGGDDCHAVRCLTLFIFGSDLSKTKPH